MSESDPVPFRIEIPTADVEDLRERLARTRWPDAETVEDWSQGIPLAYMQNLCEYWGGGYDHQRLATRLNAFPQFRLQVGGLRVHFLHVRSPHPQALPLLITHGWPGSVLEFLETIGPLVDPPAHGGDAADAFNVICPSLPGYGFSDRPAAAGFGLSAIAAAWAKLMAKLGYERYAAQGGDWGASVTMRLANLDAEHLAGIHLNLPMIAPEAVKNTTDLTAEEQAALDSWDHHRRWNSGYSAQQRTKPQTLGYGLADSPAGQCAWIVEKLATWVDHDEDLVRVLDRDTILDLVAIYWHTRTATSSARLYWEDYPDRDFTPIEVPAGCSIFPAEIFRISKRWAESRFLDLRYYNRLDRGGHFAALEQPELFVEELRNCFRQMR